MEFIKVTPYDAENIVKNNMSNKKEICACCVADEPFVIVGNSLGSNEEVAKQLNMPIAHMGNEGSTIISDVGDVDIGLLTYGYVGNDIRDELINAISNKIYNKYKIEMNIDGNDHMIENKKVIGHGSRMYGDILYTAIHISINTNLGLIRQICTKQMNKTPGQLSDYGITTVFVVNTLKRIIKKYNEQAEVNINA